MRKLIAVVALGALLIALVPAPAHAHGAALGLAAFAAFTALFALPLAVAAATYPPYYGYYGYSGYPAPVYATAPPHYVTAASSTAVSAPPSTVQREVVYPHGRYVLYGDGIRTPYQWAWVPNPPTPPAPSSTIPPPPPGAPPAPPPGR